MLLFPRNTKYKKYHNSFPKESSTEQRSIDLHFGKFAVKSLQSGHITAYQIEAFRKVIVRNLRKVSGSKFWIRIFPFVSKTEKPREVRMGKGKGSHSEWVCAVKKGKILFELKGMNKKYALLTLLPAMTKLPLKTKLIKYD